MATDAQPVYVGVDVGTGSARAAVVNGDGKVLVHHTVPITVQTPTAEHYQQSSQEIWSAVCTAVKTCCSGLSEDQVVSGIGFDATCSLVVLGDDHQPVTVDAKNGDDNWNIIMWMDHRASKEAETINSKAHSVLQYLGGKVSLEMQTPKLLWLKRHLPETWKRAKHFLDLPDYLTMRAAGTLSRSLCSLVCKWTYIHDGHKQSWDSNFLTEIGLEDLAENNFSKIGERVLCPGELCGRVTDISATELGIPSGTPVGASIIDAHAGALTLYSAGAGHLKTQQFTGILAIISGTSSCHMLCSSDRHDVPGVWGPYYSAIVPGLWCAEAGQSATGALVDHVLRSHPAANEAPEQYKNRLPQWAEMLVTALAGRSCLSDPTTLTQHLHVYPDHHGNRSPLADPAMKGMVCGLTLDSSQDDFAVTYLATLQAIAYGSRSIVERLRAHGHAVSAVLVCGGLAQSQLFTQTHADVLGVDVLVPDDQHTSVVRGAAMLGAAASQGGDLHAVMCSMKGSTVCAAPNLQHARFHEKKYKVFTKMQRDQIVYRDIMAQD